jgi:DNA-binding NarL/FixJ family response regulator
MSQPESPKQPLRILIADDHDVFRRGLREVLEEESDVRVMAEVAGNSRLSAPL